MAIHSAFIGLGIMGQPMAKNLLAKGFALVVNDVNIDAIAELVQAGAESKSLAEIGAKEGYKDSDSLGLFTGSRAR